VFQPATLEVSLELLLHKVRQRAFGLGHQGAERGVVALHQLIEQRALWLMVLK
jgi:hypothetical protein